MNEDKSNTSVKLVGTIIGFVLLAIGAQLGLVGYLIFGERMRVGSYIILFPAVAIVSFLTGLFIGKLHRRFQWFAATFIVLGATVVVLKLFNLTGFSLITTYACAALCFALAGLLIQKDKRLTSTSQ
ncbi:MAG: hypothetical protein F4Z01_06585 [Gammaproteobacteria bacterium]|nr:hypothetical protein [Gammaproteobacteria bacterium]MYF37345.1 hypothetical protein [Gammaproteobacteria bacterium]